MVLCTSGMGIAVVVVTWGAFVITADWKEHTFSLANIIKKRNLILLACVVVAFGLAFAFVPFVQQSVIRIFHTSDGSSTAISGRTWRAMRLIKKMKGVQWIAGIADTTGADYNVPGVFATLYKYGIIGVILSCWVYIRSLWKTDIAHFCMAVVILVTAFFSAHTHGTFYMLFYVLILLEGERSAEHPLLKELWGYIIKPFSKSKELKKGL